MTEHIVGQAKGYESDTIPGDFGTLDGALPEMRRRGARELQEVPVPVVRRSASGRSWAAGSSSVTEADTLLRERRVGPLEGFRSRLGKPFSASIKLNDANEVAFDFGDGGGDDRPKRPTSPGSSRSVRARSATRASSKLRRRTCAKRRSGPDKTCDFRSGRVILQRPDRARADAEAPRHRQDRSPAVRVGAHQARILGVSRSATRRQDRLRVRGAAMPAKGGARAGARRPSRLRVLGRIRATRSPSSSTRGATAPM